MALFYKELLSIKQFFINVWYHKLVASLTLMALLMISHIDEKLFYGQEPVYPLGYSKSDSESIRLPCKIW